MVGVCVGPGGSDTPSVVLVVEVGAERLQVKPAAASFASTASTGWLRAAAAAHAIAERKPEAQCASTGPSSSLSALAVPSTTRSEKASALVTGMWRKPRPASAASCASCWLVGWTCDSPSGKFETIDLKPSAAACGKSSGCSAPVTAKCGVM